ncbi:large ribosomal subunit protein mL52 [Ochlerotatus camptorhynchus]|uniref:large ribosomal subunit protein mL52 n=1 Tax=Ochlerotatus camptorhynchus TaxID=644619 RepID=UPI0031D1D494
MSLFAQVTYRGSIAPHYIIRALSSTSTYKHAGHKWCEKNNLPKNPNKSGPLTDLPDYTFMDGRVTPLGANQKKKLLQQHELATKIVTMSKEMDFALERYNKLQEEKQMEKKSILQSKLKPKGHLLLHK